MMRRRKRDGYIGDPNIVPDGQSVHVSMTMADAMMIDGIRAANPPSRGGFHYGTGYCFGDAAARDRSAAAYDAMRDRLPALYRRDQEAVGTIASSGGHYPYRAPQEGDVCRCVSGERGHLVPEPGTGALMCMPDEPDDTDDDEASDAISADEAYYQMRDALSSEWKRPRGLQRDQVSAPSPNAQPNNSWPQKEWPKGGFGADPQQHWPDPFTLQSQHEGDQCTINGADGTLQRGPDGKLVCVPNNNNRDAATVDASGISPSDRAYHEMVRRLSDEWRNPRRP